MIPSVLVIAISLFLAVGHIWWGMTYPVKEIRELGNPTTTIASYHACWYHISIVFLVTAIVIAINLVFGTISNQLLWGLWAIIFGCWLTYLWVVAAYPSMRKLGWGQIGLILVLLVNLGLVANDPAAA